MGKKKPVLTIQFRMDDSRLDYSLDVANRPINRLGVLHLLLDAGTRYALTEPMPVDQPPTIRRADGSEVTYTGKIVIDVQDQLVFTSHSKDVTLGVLGVIGTYLRTQEEQQ